MYTTKLNIRVVNQSVMENWLDSLAYYIFIFHRGKSQYFEVNYNQLANMANVSHGCMKKHIDILVSQGLIHFNQNKSYLAKLSMRKKKGSLVAFQYSQRDISIIKTELRCFILGLKLNAQRHQIDKKKEVLKVSSQVDANQMVSVSSIKFLNKNKDLINKGEFLESTVLSGDGFGKILNRSRATGYRWLNKLKSLGKIEIIKRFKTIYCSSSLEYNILRNECIIPFYAFFNEGTKTISIPIVSKVQFVQ